MKGGCLFPRSLLKYKVNSMTHTVRLSSTEVRYYRSQLKVHSLFTRTTNWYFGWLVGYGSWLQV